MRRVFLTLFTLFCLLISVHAQWMWNADKMKEIKSNLNSFTYANAYRTLIDDAEGAMRRGAYSVTFKEGLAPSGDKHDYVSLSRYVWPDPSKKDGLPYITRDGESNPELEKYDRNPLGNMASSVTTLSLAYYYSGDERYALKAVDLLRVWFLNKDTKMNPHLTYAQFVPGQNDNKGRPFGLIDTYSFVDMLNAVKLLESSNNYTSKDRDGLQEWFSQLKKWWQTDEQAIAEKNGKNNHGLAYDVQLVMYSLFSGDKDTALKVINEFPKLRLFDQIMPDGSQPHELRRTLAYHYSAYNLCFMVDMTAIAKNQGIEIYKMQSADGRSLYKAIDFLSPYLGKSKSSWPYKQISGWDGALQSLCKELYRVSTIDPSRQDYLQLYKTYSKQGLSDRNRLLYGATDPIEEAFAFAGKQFQYAYQCADDVMAKSKNTKKAIPRTINKDGSLRLVDPRDWCSGFFPGSQWFMYAYTKDDKWKAAADKYSKIIEVEKFDRTSHDVGFKMFSSFGNGYKLTGDESYKEVVIQSAKTLIKRYNAKIGSIRSWDFNRKIWQFPVIIDNMMNLELLFEASKYTGDKIYYDIADTHAETTLKNHFRNDYSSYHVVDYDTITGKARHKQTLQGFSDSSAWARGQAWGVYGFTMAYRYTQKTEYLKQAEGIADFMFTHPNLPQDMIPYWDYNDTGIPNVSRDASAAAISASALYELAQYIPEKKDLYMKWADTILANLIQYYETEVGTNYGFLLLHSTGHKPGGDEIDVPISYADYYFLEALLRRNRL